MILSRDMGGKRRDDKGTCTTKMFSILNSYKSKQGDIVYDTTKSDGQYRKTASNKKLRSFLPEFKFTPIDQAICQTAEWFEANYETCRK